MSPIHHGRRIGSAAALVLAGAFSAGCIDGQAQDNGNGPSRAADAPRPLPPAQADPAKQSAPVPAPGVAVEPHGSRPIDDGAIRALAEEVARLRAELAKMRERNPDAAVAAEAAPPTSPSQPPLLTDGPATQPAPSAAAPVDPRSSEPETTAPVQGPERVVERVVEREVPVYIEVPGVERVVETVVEVEVAPQYVIETGPTVYVERVVYRDTSCEQTISYGHVHHIGCGHHYYGCSCHPWYYNLDGGFGIQFFHVGHDGHDDHDGHGDHGRPPRGTYARGYNNGFDAGYDAGNDVRPPARPPVHPRGNGSGRNPDEVRERGPSEPVRRLENGGSERPSAQQPPAAPTAPRHDGGARAPGDVGQDSRAPREPSRRAPPRADSGALEGGRQGADRGPRADGNPQPRHTRPDSLPPRAADRSPRDVTESVPVPPARPEPQRTRPTPRPDRDDSPARDPQRTAPENRGERRIDPPVQRPQVERRDPPVLRQPETPRAPAPRRPDAPERRPRHRKGEEEGK